jgi:hypothetical protein
MGRHSEVDSPVLEAVLASSFGIGSLYVTAFESNLGQMYTRSSSFPETVPAQFCKKDCESGGFANVVLAQKLEEAERSIGFINVIQEENCSEYKGNSCPLLFSGG